MVGEQREGDGPETMPGRSAVDRRRFDQRQDRLQAGEEEQEVVRNLFPPAATTISAIAWFELSRWFHPMPMARSQGGDAHRQANMNSHNAGDDRARRRARPISSVLQMPAPPSAVGHHRQQQRDPMTADRNQHRETGGCLEGRG